MPLRLLPHLTAGKLVPKIERLFELSARKILSLEKTWLPARGTPVFTARGRYTSRGWTEWTQGFQYGSALLQFDATGEERFLELGRRHTLERMAPHVSHVGVHDHGFNNISTYGNLWRLMRAGRLRFNDRELDGYELALKVSGAVQAARWTTLADGTGFIHSFNGPHSLFVDTVRSLRVLGLGHQLGHVLMGEQDLRISLLARLVEHGLNTARYNLYYGERRDAYDVPGRTAHEAIFNTRSGLFRCPNSQQGYSPFSTWTRGLAWAICGFAELLEFLETVPAAAFHRPPTRPPGRSVGTPARHPLSATATRKTFLRAASVTAEFYLSHCCADGIPLWDTGAPDRHRLGDYASQPSDPFNAWEPVDSSAAAIAAQGLLRLGNYLGAQGHRSEANRYRLAAFTVADTLFDEPYLSTHPKHQGLILHSVYHRPNGWDYVAPKQKVPNGESSMWGDYHARELALLILREARAEPYLTFFRP
ncbi:MAG: glycosyl hydrolase [Verrucomicrobia bacterium]|nr:glycosyl hydrolase [Verrucomicrobiota bacterium]